MSDAVRRPKPLLGLIACVVLMLAWWAGDGWRSERTSIEQRKATAVRLAARLTVAGAGETGRPAQGQQSARKLREDLSARLLVNKSLQAARAEVYYELRERCAAVKLRCVIRLSEPTSRPAQAQPGSTPAPEGLVGVQRLQARLSGNLSEQAIQTLLDEFAPGRSEYWRVLQVQVKGRGFELEVERLVVVPHGAAAVGLKDA